MYLARRKDGAAFWGHCCNGKKSEVTSSVSHAGATAAIFPLSAVGIASGMISGLLGVAWSLEKLWQKIVTSRRTTVDGSEIRRENHRWDEKQPCKNSMKYRARLVSLPVEKSANLWTLRSIIFQGSAVSFWGVSF